MKFLVKKGADINQPLNYQESPLKSCCLYSSIDCLLFLLDHNVNIVDQDDERPILCYTNILVTAIILEYL